MDTRSDLTFMNRRSSANAAESDRLPNDVAKASRKRNNFQTNRKSFMPNDEIIRENSQADYERKITLKRQSRFYSQTSSQEDLLDPKTRVTLEWKDVKLVEKPQYGLIDRLLRRPRPEEIILVDEASGRVSPGEMFAIMGPTGSGKTSLLRTLAGIAKGEAYGQILVNGNDRSSTWKHVIAYIEAGTSSLNPFLTVRESLNFVANLCLPEKYSAEEKRERVKHVIRAMGLEKVIDSMIGDSRKGMKSISGGERKRLCIALELLREPKALFLDEPTSGLDAATAKAITKYLHRLAVIDSLTIIMTLHQPRLSILSKFEEVCLLAQGSPVFIGSIDEAMDFFAIVAKPVAEFENPTEYFIDIIQSACTGDGEVSLQKLKEEWKNYSKYYSRPLFVRSRREADEKSREFQFNASRWTEVKELIARDHRINTRELNYLVYLLVLWIMLAIIVSFLWFQMSKTDFSGVQDRVGLVATVPMDGTLILSINTVLLIRSRTRSERSISMYRLSSFFAAMLILAIPSAIGLSILYLTIIYYMTALRYSPFSAYLVYIGINLLHVISGYVVVYTIGSLAKDFTEGMVVGGIFIIVTRLFSGGPVNLAEISPVLSWLRYLSPVFYVTQGLAQNEFNDQIIADRPGEFWTRQYALDLISIPWSAGGLMIYTFILAFVACYLYHIWTKPVFNIKTRSINDTH